MIKNLTLLTVKEWKGKDIDSDLMTTFLFIDESGVTHKGYKPSSEVSPESLNLATGDLKYDASRARPYEIEPVENKKGKIESRVDVSTL